MVIDRSTGLYTMRNYQVHGVNATEAAWRGDRRPTGTGVVNRTGVVWATGLGKTIAESELIRRAHHRGERAIFLCHREELAQQAMAKLHSIVPTASIGLVKADRNEWMADVVVASVPTLGRTKRLEQIPANRFGIGIADECHHAAADSWRGAMGYFGAWNGMPWGGFTATMARGDSKALGEVWPEVVDERDIAFGIKHGHLVPVSGIRVQVKNLRLDEVRRSRGDLQDDDLGQALEDADAGNVIAKAYLEHCPGRRAAMVLPTVATAVRFAEIMLEHDIPAEVIVGTTTTEQRAAMYERFRTGETLMLVSVMVLTEGWDAPWCEVLIMARPTTSNALYIQCVGRALRPFPQGGKTSALVLDVVGASTRNKLASLVDLFPGEGRSPYPEDDDGEEPEEREPGGGAAMEEDIREYADGELVSEVAELFAESDSAWLQTRHGLWFIATRESYFYLWPKGDGTFGLGQKSVKGRRGHGQVLENGLIMEAGMAWAERYAVDEEAMGDSGPFAMGSVSSRHASWRRRKPSLALLNFARGLGIPGDGLSQGELGDLVTIARASHSLPVPKARVG